MLSRLVTSTLRRSLILPVRNLRVSSVALGGGGHDHHEPLPVYQPKPGPFERNYFGEGKAGRISQDDPYTPTGSDYSSFIGAGVGVLLTFLAVAYKTDAFKSDKGGHGHHDSHAKGHAKSSGHQEESKGHHEETKEHQKEGKAHHEEAAAPKEESKPQTEEAATPKEDETAPAATEPTTSETAAQSEVVKEDEKVVSESPAEEKEQTVQLEETVQPEQTTVNEPSKEGHDSDCEQGKTAA